jgi:hypothetical protein
MSTITTHLHPACSTTHVPSPLSHPYSAFPLHRFRTMTMCIASDISPTTSPASLVEFPLMSWSAPILLHVLHRSLDASSVHVNTPLLYRHSSRPSAVTSSSCRDSSLDEEGWPEGDDVHVVHYSSMDGRLVLFYLHCTIRFSRIEIQVDREAR